MMPAGRPTSYKPEYAQLAEKMCKLGATDKDLAEAFGVSEQTINAWKQANPEFLESLTCGKVIADAEVAAKLFHRATGYSHSEDDIKVVQGAIVITPTTKHYPPDSTAAIFWLKNRRPKDWRETKAVELTGANGGPVETAGRLDVSGLSSQALAEILALKDAANGS
jgi:DNA-binding XRE family transcriptional regulator